MRQYFIYLVVVITCLFPIFSSASAQSRHNPADHFPHRLVVIQTTTQLPRSIRPTHYKVSFVPNAVKANFTSNVTIHIDVLEPTSSITLNATNLTFQGVKLRSAEHPQEVMPTKINVNVEKQTASFEFAHTIAVGQYALSIAYSGLIEKQASGLFYIEYDTSNGPKRALYTQFETADARRFIPSWDEPAYKATFDLEAIISRDEMAVSNMPIVRKEDLSEGRSLITFATTPRMSTYLLFFGLGDFERVSADINGTQVGVVTQKGVLTQADFAFTASKELLQKYNDYFAVLYPLPKLDNIAAPGSSSFFSAMENWGAILTFEQNMLLDPTNFTQKDRERAFIIVAHEMAHQWFGNLVTMHWWDDLWLNEGFASWMESHMAERLHPEWSTHLAAVDVQEAAMKLDSLSTTHPVVQHIDSVEQAEQAFDGITYQKGEAVIRMLENYVGADTWREGVRIYMKKHAYGNTTSDDFWRAIEEANKVANNRNQIATKTGIIPITAIAHDFTLQPGIPMIVVDNVRCKDGKTTVYLTQSEFSRDQWDKKPLGWRVPVTAQLLDNGNTTQTLVTKGKAKMHLAGCGPVIINAGRAGYFRTLYAPKQFAALANRFSMMAPIDQLSLLVDSWALGLAGKQPITDFLNLANATSTKANPNIWKTIAEVYRTIYLNYQGNPKHQQQFSQFAIARLAPVLAHIGWNARPDDTTAVANLREQLIDVLSQLRDTQTIAEANRRYAAQGIEFPVELRKVILRVVALHADVVAWDQLHAAAKAEKSSMMKEQRYILLASSQDPVLASRALEIAITDEPGATTSPGMISKVAYLHPDLAFDFAIKHLTHVQQLVSGNSRNQFIPKIASRSADPAMIEKLQAYAKAHIVPNAQSSTNTAIADINFQIKMRAQRLPEIGNWIELNKN
ncbi:MAG: peptidase family protein [Solimicrobium sp.]|jgi:aminopeptidase N|nr:peptidase family protein [Solimicrobium sp.]